MTDEELTRLARDVGERARRRGVVLATAESCTGGGVAEAITRIPGSSAWFDRGFVTYSNEAKQRMLGVDPILLARHGAVSEEVARAMAQGGVARSDAGACVAVTGIAGPGGATLTKPVGLVWLAWAVRGAEAQSRRFVFAGDRAAVRGQAVAAALEGLRQLLGP